MVEYLIYFMGAWTIGFMLLEPYRRWCELKMKEKEDDS